jgi:hypothetical protein
MAAALGTPVVDLYALTNPQHTPWGVPHRVLFHDVPCKFCYKSICPEGHYHCLSLLTPDEIFRAACELFSETTTATYPDTVQYVSSELLPLPSTNYFTLNQNSDIRSAKEIWR